MAVYSWLTLASAISSLQRRLSNGALWTSTEVQAYMTQSLHEWSALTEQWKLPFNFLSSSTVWYNTGTLAGSPRLRTITDVSLYTQMQYMLLEPPTGGTWTGTTQFTIQMLQDALQNRVAEVIQASGCNLGNQSLASTPNVNRVVLPDTVLEPRRLRFVPVSMYGNPITLTREDTQAFQFFKAGYLGSQPTSGPNSWSVAAEPPLAFDVDSAPNVPGAYDLVSLNSGPVFAPPAASLLGIPDDWSYLAMWGALGDILGSEPEQTDRERADYCLKRFDDGLKIMRQSNWLVNANINGVPCDTPSMAEQDLYSPEWEESTTAWPSVVQAGIDYVGICPVGAANVGLTLIGNAPILDATNTYLQVSRDDWEAVLGYAQRLASFKLGGTSFASTDQLEKNFYMAAQETNKRLMDMGIFTDLLNSEGKRQDEAVPR